MKYVNYWRKKNENWSLVGFFVSGVCNCVKGVWKYLGRKICKIWII